jgi:hypothetical protein
MGLKSFFKGLFCSKARGNQIETPIEITEEPVKVIKISRSC